MLGISGKYGKERAKKALFPEETSGKVSQDIQHPGSRGHTAPPRVGTALQTQVPSLQHSVRMPCSPRRGHAQPQPPTQPPEVRWGHVAGGHGSWQQAAQMVEEMSRGEAW